MENRDSDYKIVSVTSKRQITIPKKYFDAMRIGEQVKCYMDGRRLVIEPAHADEFWDFSTDVLRELVAEGYSGEDLLREFDSRKTKVTRALEQMAKEARDDLAAGRGRPVEDVFRELLDDDEL
ncbi:MAG: AbrB/MazE/SpoVT family DNA-binding domain-containing protein [Dethiobacter sp.]|jgi:bifunctional DNA-binding transcriptional regulator/antitoxin component of YhaV-PrlF toxin-antitoxin module|nr:AbrB/MazE/SpoVT family DNA-binding domain-containing protein [Dethiobacter sp.]